MRFIGSKAILLEDIYHVIRTEIHEPIEIVGDLFSSSSVVSQFLKQKGYKPLASIYNFHKRKKSSHE